MIQHLASKDNRHVVEAAKLKLAKYQKETGLFLVEGYHLLQMAIEHQAVKEVFTTKVIPDLQVDQYVVNEDILEDVSIINRDPYDTGWLVVIEMDNLEQLEDLLAAANYHDLIMQEEGE